MFETEGIGSFGELRRDLSVKQGSSVQLYLRPEVIGKSLQEFYESVRSYLVSSLHWIPCKFVLRSTMPGCEELALSPGWTWGEERLASLVLSQMGKQRTFSTAGALLSRAKQQQVEKEKAHWKSVSEEASKCLRWVFEEGDLPRGLGKYRIAMPYFELLGEKVLAFMRATDSGGNISLGNIGNGFIHVNHGRVNTSWKGILPFASRGPLSEQFAPNLDYEFFYSSGNLHHGRKGEIDVQTIVCDVNWESSEAGGITVNRHALRTSDRGSEALRWLSEKVRLIRKSFLKGQQYKHFMTLNYRVAEVEPYPLGCELRWVVQETKEAETTARWTRYSFPVTTNVWFREPPKFDLEWEGKGVSVVDCLREPNSKEFNDGMTWHTAAIGPDRIVVCPKVFWEYPRDLGHHRNRLRRQSELDTAIPGQEEDADYADVLCNLRFGIVPLWTEAPTKTQSRVTSGLACDFPPNWTCLCGVKFESYTGSQGAQIWNPAHPIIRQLDREAWQWANKVFRTTQNPLPYRDELLVSAARASSWVVQCVRESSYEMWDALAESNPEFLPSIWSLIFGPQVESNPFVPICQWVEARHDSKLRALTPNGWVAHRDWNKSAEEFKRFLPDPGPSWRLLPKSKVKDVETA